MVTRDKRSKKFIISFQKLLQNYPNFLDYIRAQFKLETEPNTIIILGEENRYIFIPLREIEKRIRKGGLATLNLELDIKQDYFVLRYIQQELGSPLSYYLQIDFIYRIEDHNYKLEDIRKVKSFIKAKYRKECIHGEEVLGIGYSFDITKTYYQLQRYKDYIYIFI